MSPQTVVGPVPAPQIHVMSWNLCRSGSPFSVRPGHRWPARAPRVEALLRRERPHLLGVQEAMPDQMAALRQWMGPRLASVGHSRSRGDDEACAILYDTDRLELLGWRQLALSDTPDVPGSRGWGNPLPRIVVTAALRDRATAAQLLAVNTQWDPFSARSRRRSAAAVLELVHEADGPVVLTGDLNESPRGPAVRRLRSAGTLVDAWQAAEAREDRPWGTFPNHRPPRRGGRRIDGILVSPQVRVRRFTVNAARERDGWASDHLPVQAVLELPTPGSARGGRVSG